MVILHDFPDLVTNTVFWHVLPCWTNYMWIYVSNWFYSRTVSQSHDKAIDVFSG